VKRIVEEIRREFFEVVEALHRSYPRAPA